MSESGFVWHLPYVYARDGAHVDAIVTWNLPDRPNGSVTTTGYAPDPGVIRSLVGTTNEEKVDLVRDGKLTDSMDLYRGLQGIYRVTVTDSRGQCDYLLSYRVRGSYRPMLRPRTVYRFWDGSRVADARTHRELTGYIGAPDAHVITSLGARGPLNLKDKRVRSRLGLDRPVVVWDYHRLYS